MSLPFVINDTINDSKGKELLFSGKPNNRETVLIQPKSGEKISVDKIIMTNTSDTRNYVTFGLFPFDKITGTDYQERINFKNYKKYSYGIVTSGNTIEFRDPSTDLLLYSNFDYGYDTTNYTIEGFTTHLSNGNLSDSYMKESSGDFGLGGAGRYIQSPKIDTSMTNGYTRGIRIEVMPDSSFDTGVSTTDYLEVWAKDKYGNWNKVDRHSLRDDYDDNDYPELKTTYLYDKKYNHPNFQYRLLNEASSSSDYMYIDYTKVYAQGRDTVATYISEPIDLSSVGILDSSLIYFFTKDSNSSEVDVSIRVSKNNGTTWSNYYSISIGDSIPELNTGDSMIDVMVQFKIELNSYKFNIRSTSESYRVKLYDLYLIAGSHPTEVKPYIFSNKIYIEPYTTVIMNLGLPIDETKKLTGLQHKNKDINVMVIGEKV